MAKTNLLKPLTNTVGEFFMFSQYADDLTKEMSQKSTYKVIPSKFAALDIDVERLYSVASKLEGYVPGDETMDLPDMNKLICKYLQNSYENSCAFFRTLDGNPDNENEVESAVWSSNNFMASRLLWQNLMMYGFITLKDGEEDEPKYCPEIKYVGDINITSSRNFDDGLNYNEIYCYIPTNAKDSKYYMENLDDDGEIPAEGDPVYFQYEGNTLLGWNANNYPANLTTAGIPNAPSFGTDLVEGLDGSVVRVDEREGGYTIEDEYWYYPSALSHLEPDEGAMVSVENNNTDGYFYCNSILVFYDIWDGNDCICRNLPLGMYFTGLFNNEEEGLEFNNTIKKFINNGDIFGQGTSYGFRIMTKQICTPNSIFYTDTVVEVSNDKVDFYPEYESLMTEMSKTLAKMDTVVEANRLYRQDIKDHLAMFKNYRTNVPYIRFIKNVPYWFVNGRNTGQRAVVVETYQDTPEWASLINNVNDTLIDMDIID